ncbi:heterokaryon incompatibility protein-domain-containing protein [Fusarium venenatum]|uniref:heterokaryon incompatibility protein-domain-containing protein n=1 Tax=Fusarium venenatum TaxID=56646 RepID=UPI001D4452AE|nr:heterokaryon incompatibility protein-domain-containing protein [Fusarium venenatum]
MTEHLCSDCLPLEETLQNYSSNYSTRILKSSITSLEQSAKQGCPLCRVIYQSFIYDEGVSFQDTNAPIEISTKDSTIDSDSYKSRLDILSVKIRQQSSTNSTYLSVLFNDGAQELAFEAYKELVGQLQDPTSEEGIDHLARLTSTWITNCRNTHSQCGHQNIPHSFDRVPTRLIDVGTDDNSQPPKLFLPSQGQASENIEYVALSYAWGSASNHPTRTSASNIQEMLEGLPFSRLPKTIRDAIIFTRKLGFKYLWVDALCILQSEGPHDRIHKEDWSHETSRFGYYYRNAAVTLAATGAKSSDCGLFLSRPALAFDPKPVILQRKTPTGHIGDISILPKVPSWISEIKRAPLYERGWAIQERILSARVVHFAANMVLWECHECRATEIDTTGASLRDANSGMVYEEVSDFMPVFRNLQRNGKGANQVIREWYSFIEGYTAAKFTFMGDRLPALSGIAALIQKYIPKRYGAGLWESAIPEGLAWLVDYDELTENTSDLTTAYGPREDFQLMLPSWSWATSRGPVRFLSSLESWEPLLKMEDWEVKSAGVDTSGQILGARLRVRSALKVFSAFDLGIRMATRLNSRDGQVSLTHAASMDAGFSRHDTYTCILVGTAYVPGSDRKEGVTGCALILEATGCSRGSIQEYKRVGLSCLPFEDWWTKDMQEKTIELV